MQVKEIMTHNPACCTSDSGLQEVARKMVENDCGCIPIIDSYAGMKPIGTITDRDITVSTVAGGQNPLLMQASDIMSIDLATVKPDTSLEECLRTMEERDIRRILVVDEQGRCCGIVAQADIVKLEQNPLRTTDFIREISESGPSRKMTMSKGFENASSYLRTGTVVPVLIGIGSIAALIYFGSQRKNSRYREDSDYQIDEEPEFTPVPITDRYVDADEEIERRQQKLENRVRELKSEIQSAVENIEPSTTEFLPSAGRFELKQSGGGQFYFNLRAGNGQIILSSEVYNSKDAAQKGIESVRKNASDSRRYEHRVNQNQEPYFVLKAGNGEIIGRSETFSSEIAMENAISTVMKNAPDAEISETAS